MAGFCPRTDAVAPAPRFPPAHGEPGDLALRFDDHLLAIPYQVFRSTGSSLAVGLVGLVELVCLLSLAFVGGVLADAIDRRRLVLGSEAGLALCAMALLANASLGQVQLWPIFVVAGAMAGLDAIQRPALDSLVPRLVDASEINAAAAIGAMEGTVGMIAGPALAGLLIVWPGVAATYAVDVATFGGLAARAGGHASGATATRRRATKCPPGVGGRALRPQPA